MKLTTENFVELTLEKEFTTRPIENATEVNLSKTNNNLSAIMFADEPCGTFPYISYRDN